MSKITFSEEQIEILKRNPNVKRVSEKEIRRDRKEAGKQLRKSK